MTPSAGVGVYLIPSAYVFEVSSNLVNWTAFSTNPATETVLELGDAPSGYTDRQYYRAWVVP